MKVFALSDVHVDYPENKKWLFELSQFDYREDVLILAGDLTDNLLLLKECFRSVQGKFKSVLYLPGNHELWIRAHDTGNSIDKFHRICELAVSEGLHVTPQRFGALTIVPLFSWFDFSFGTPNTKLRDHWMDFRMCSWPKAFDEREVCRYFHALNVEHLAIKNETVISFSHFLPRIDLMPMGIPESIKYIFPVLGSSALESQIRQLSPSVHIYGHSHLNRNKKMDSTTYINNAYGYPNEGRICRKKLISVYRSF